MGKMANKAQIMTTKGSMVGEFGDVLKITEYQGLVNSLNSRLEDW